jgi:hypothetical protein
VKPFSLRVATVKTLKMSRCKAPRSEQRSIRLYVINAATQATPQSGVFKRFYSAQQESLLISLENP